MRRAIRYLKAVISITLLLTHHGGAALRTLPLHAGNPLLVRQRGAAGGTQAFASGTRTASAGAHAAAPLAAPHAASRPAAGSAALTLSAPHDRTSFPVSFHF